MQCVCLELSFHKNRGISIQPGIGVTMSDGVYLSDTGKMLVARPAESSDGVGRSIPRPLLVVASGKTTTVRLGLSAMRRESSMLPSGDGFRTKDDSTAAPNDSCLTLRDPGKLCTKIGSKMAARYTTSTGEVNEDAMTDPGVGSLATVLPKDLRAYQSGTQLTWCDVGRWYDVSSPSMYTINSNVDEPDSWNTNNAPQIGFSEDASRRCPLDNEQPYRPGEDEEWQPQEE